MSTQPMEPNPMASLSIQDIQTTQDTPNPARRPREMYAPCRARRKKTAISRNRTGCYTCRRRHLKCDETKPACRYCLRLGIACVGYALRYSFVDATATTRIHAEKIESRKTSSRRSPEHIGGVDDSPARMRMAKDTDQRKPTSRPCVVPPRSHDSMVSGNDETGVTPSQTIAPPSCPTPTEATATPLRLMEAVSPSDILGSWSPLSWALSTADPLLSPLSTLSPLPPLSPLSPRLMPSLSPDPDLTHAERSYIAHFNTHVAALLPPAFQTLRSRISETPILQRAAMALAASNLSSLSPIMWETVDPGGRPQRRLCSGPPNYMHLQAGLQLYNQTIRMLYMERIQSADDAVLQVTATILLAFFELESGSPQAYFTHVRGADTIVQAQHARMCRTSVGRDILSAWALMHAESRMLRLPFRLLDIEGEGGDDDGGNECAKQGTRKLLREYASQEGQMLAALVEAFGIRNRAVLEWCMRVEHEDTEATLRRCVSWYTKHFNFSYTTEGEGIPNTRRYAPSDHLVRQLGKLRAQLDAWHDGLGLEALPIERFTARRLAAAASATAAANDGSHTSDKASPLVIESLAFRTSAAAMTYLQYAVAQLLASGDVLQALLAPEPASRSPINPWVVLILRIATGLVADHDCGYGEPYSLGLLRLLYETVLCAPDMRVIDYVLDELMRPMEHHARSNRYLAADLGPYQCLLRLIRHQVRAGRMPYRLTPKVLPTAERIYPDNFASEGQWVALHGRTSDGSRFNEFVWHAPTD